MQCKALMKKTAPTFTPPNEMVEYFHYITKNVPYDLPAGQDAKLCQQN